MPPSSPSIKHAPHNVGKETREKSESANAADRKRLQDEALDDALAQTFPASDPVACW
jgi:hypothetical protein